MLPSDSTRKSASVPASLKTACPPDDGVTVIAPLSESNNLVIELVAKAIDEARIPKPPNAEPALLIKGDRLYGLSREGIILPFDKQIQVLPLVTGRRFSSARCFDRLKDPDIAYAVELYD